MQDSLFETPKPYQPLASRMRPKTLEGYFGQDHILGEGKPLRLALEQGVVHSMVLWGPPGVGKTTLAKLMANYVNAQFIELSAVLSGVKEIRESVAKAKQNLAQQRKTVLFVDEVHRFNKSQQDAFLPYIEDGTHIFIGATTENPSFELNSALLSRARVYVLKGFEATDLERLMHNALQKDDILKSSETCIPETTIATLALAANGDARSALNLLEISLDLAGALNRDTVDQEVLEQALQQSSKRFDKGGDVFYEQISALHKAVRGSSVDGALYWYARMIDGGCDPFYIARRVVRMATEDIGNADPRGLQLAINAWEVQERLGSPEGELAIAQAIVYLAAAPKSNAVYNAWNTVLERVKATPDYEVPMHIRNAPTGLMKDLGYGEEYRYSHDEPGAYSAGECYLPEALSEDQYYKPVDRGLEQKIKQKLEHLKQLDQESNHRRYR